MTVCAFIPGSTKGEVEEPVLYITDLPLKSVTDHQTVLRKGYVKREAAWKLPLPKGLTLEGSILLFSGRHNGLMQWMYLTGR